MKDWTKEPPEPTKAEIRAKERIMSVKRTLDFVSEHPDGVTAKDFHEAGVPCVGIERLMKLGQIKGFQIREPERGTRAYHWLWKINKT